VRVRLFLLLAIILLNHLAPFSKSLANPQETEVTYVYTSKIVFVNNGGDSLVLSEDFCSLNLFPNSSWQTTYLQSVNQPYNLTTDSDQNQILLLDVPPIPQGGNITLQSSLKIVERQRQTPSVSYRESKNLNEIPAGLEKYCGARGSWQVDDEALKSLAEEILSEGKTFNVLMIVAAFADWIGTNVKPVSHEFPLYPNKTYARLEGDCDDQANLLITLCRIMKIPAYLQIGCIRNSVAETSTTAWDGRLVSVSKNVAFHGWAVIYVPPWGWLPFDVTLGWKSSNSLEGITSAAVWRSDTIVVLNVTKSDWAGLGRRQRDYVISNSLHVYSEYSLDLYDTRPDDAFWKNPVLLAGASITIIIVGGYLARSKLPKRLSKTQTSYITPNPLL